ncbi:hypothetical protein Tco_0428121 [Tanacetum coccineum]
MDYPLPDGQKMPSHIGSYDGKGDLDNFLHLFEGATRMQKWLMPVACHMFTYTLKDYARIRLCSWLENKKFGRASLHGPSIHLQRSNGEDLYIEDREIEIDSPPYRGPNYGLLPSLSKSPKEILATEKAARSFKPPLKMFESKRSRDTSKYCHFHEDYEHDTNYYRHLRTQIQEAVNLGQLSHLMKGIKKERTKSSDTTKGESKKDKGAAPAKAPILMRPVSEIGGRVYIDIGSILRKNNLLKHCFEKLNPAIKATKVDLKTPLVGFSGECSWSIGEVPTAMQMMGIVVSTIHKAIKFHNEKGIGTVFSIDEADEGVKRARKIN